ncbi:MAG: hypothetical protein A2341_18040 [Deltaproteobacteria bacterium RIFOXYB12_FULL_58_9]|nr:MAG: hypothetical protein A2341_18040 [Deltaproteobacteria bacterium RIFOXYB12_FULL_58_9]
MASLITLSVPPSLAGIGDSLVNKINQGETITENDIKQLLEQTNRNDGAVKEEASFIWDIGYYAKNENLIDEKEYLRLFGISANARRNPNLFVPEQEGVHTVKGAAAAYMNLPAEVREPFSGLYVKGDDILVPADHPNIRELDRQATYRTKSFSIEWMKKNFTVTPEMESILNNVDTLNVPKYDHPDGFVSIGELVQWTTVAAILPDERPWIPELFELMKASPVAKVECPVFLDPAERFVDNSVWPTKRVDNVTELDVSLFPPEMQRELCRAKVAARTNNEDQPPLNPEVDFTTITLDDLKYATTRDFKESTPAQRKVWQKALELWDEIAIPVRRQQLEALGPQEYRADQKVPDSLFNEQSVNLTQTEHFAVWMERTPKLIAKHTAFVNYSCKNFIEVPEGTKLVLIPETDEGNRCRSSMQFAEKNAIEFGPGKREVKLDSKAAKYRAYLIKDKKIVEETEFVNIPQTLSDHPNNGMNKMAQFESALPDFASSTTSGKPIYFNAIQGANPQEIWWTYGTEQTAPTPKKVPPNEKIALASGMYEKKLSGGHVVRIAVLNEPNQITGGAVKLEFDGGGWTHGRYVRENFTKYVDYKYPKGAYVADFRTTQVIVDRKGKLSVISRGGSCNHNHQYDGGTITDLDKVG